MPAWLAVSLDAESLPRAPTAPPTASSHAASASAGSSIAAAAPASSSAASATSDAGSLAEAPQSAASSDVGSSSSESVPAIDLGSPSAFEVSWPPGADTTLWWTAASVSPLLGPDPLPRHAASSGSPLPPMVGVLGASTSAAADPFARAHSAAAMLRLTPPTISLAAVSAAADDRAFSRPSSEPAHLTFIDGLLRRSPLAAPDMQMSVAAPTLLPPAAAVRASLVAFCLLCTLCLR
jgi:hypothetical protein